MGAVKNVVVFTARDTTFALELGWIREIFNLSYVTPVPHAPRAIVGVVNFRGSIISVIELSSGKLPHIPAVAGESALLLEVNRVQFALRAGVIDEVSSLELGDDGLLTDTQERPIQLVDPRSLLENLVDWKRT